MTTKLHVLIIEDLPSDAELAQHQIKKALQDHVVQVVETEENFVKSLKIFKPDLIISDYKLPSFDGLSALKIAQKKAPFTPFVILTGSMNEDTAVECMKAGADDYVIKEHIKRLGPAILNAMKKKQVEFERMQTQREYKQLIDGMNDTAFVINFEGKFIEINKAAVQVLGYTRDELLAMGPADIDTHLSEDDIGKMIKGMKSDKKQVFETGHRTKDGRIIPVEINPSRITYKGKKVILSIARDITERNKAREKIKASESKYRDIFDNIQDAYYETDINGIILECSPSIKVLSKGQYTREELIGMKMSNFYLDPHAREKFIEELIKHKRITDYEITLKNKDGSLIECSLSSVLQLDASGKPEKIIGSMRDITERKKAEEQIKKELQENKILLREVHHRTKNNLQTINSLLQLQQDTIKTKADAIKSFEVSQDRIRTMAQAYEILLGSEYMSDVKLSEYLTLLAGQLKRNYDTHNKITISYSLENVQYETEKLSKIGLIVNEILTNALKYAFKGRDKGNISIELKDAKNHITIKISDDGIGIPENIDIHKPATLGLSLVDMLLEEFDGTYSVDRKNGTSFTLEIPKERKA
jgi:PAS domain S-box-containing protein